jgi:hypothetical protein
MADPTLQTTDPKTGSGAAGAGAGADKGAGAGAAGAGKGAAGSAGGAGGDKGASAGGAGAAAGAAKGAGAAQDPITILTDPTDPAAGAKISWPGEGFPDDWRERMSGKNDKVLNVLKRFQSPMGLANAILADRQAISEGKLRPSLPQNATPEQITEYRKSNGIPETHAGYLEKLPDGLVIGESDKEIVAKFTESMHGLHAPPDIVHAALRSYYDAVAYQAQQFQDMNEEAKNAGIHELSVELGNQYKPTLNAINNLLAGFDQETRDFISDLRDSKGLMAFNKPGFLKALGQMAIAQNPANTVVPNHGGRPGVAVDEEIASIEAKMRGANAQAEYWNQPAVQERYRVLLTTREQIKGQSRAA